MNLEERLKRVRDVVGDTGYLIPEKGRMLVEFMVEHRLMDVLELGFAFGVSTCYLAAAVDALGGGEGCRITSIDRLHTAELSPRAETLLAALGFSGLVSLKRVPTCYTWHLMRMLEEDPTPRLDLCFIDGAHSWAVDGLAFLLADRLLRPGGWVILDDMEWTYAASPTMERTAAVADMPEDERTTPQVAKVYELLVKTQPGYDTFERRDNWAFARKSPESPPAGWNADRVRVETRYLTSPLSHLLELVRGLRGGRPD